MADPFGGNINVINSNTAVFTNTLCNDMVVYTNNKTQRIVIGTSNTGTIIVNSNNAFVSGKLGINNSNPNFAVDITGDLNLTGNLLQNGTTYVGSQWTSSSSNIYITGSNIGINNATPAFPLDVNGDINFTGTLRQGGVIYGGGPGGQTQWSSLSSNVYVLGSNVGIGKANPQYELDITGSLFVTSNIIGAGAIVMAGLDLNGNTGGFTNVTSQIMTVNGLCNELYGTMLWAPSNNSNNYLRFIRSNASSSTEIMRINTNGTVGINTANPTEGLHLATRNAKFDCNVYVLSNLGIGKSNPQYPLDITGDLNFTGTLRQNGTAYVGSQWSNSGSNVFIVGSNIGIGKSNPQCQLDIAGSLAVASNIITTGAITMNGLDLNINNGGLTNITSQVNNITGFSNETFGIQLWTSSNNSNNYWRFVSSNAASSSEIVRINTNGNIGIGTPTPLTQLHVTCNIAGSIGPRMLLENQAGSTGAGCVIDFATYSTGTSFGSNNARIGVFDNGDFSSYFSFLTKIPGSGTNGMLERLRISAGSTSNYTNVAFSSNLTVNGTLTTNNVVINGTISAANLSFRNKIINGAMNIAQRGTAIGLDSPVGTFYACDRFGTAASGTFSISNYQISLNSNEAPFNQGFRKSNRVVVSSYSPATNYLLPTYTIEAQDIVDLNWGTSAGVPMNLSFWFKTGSNVPANSCMNAVIRRFPTTLDAYCVPFVVTASNTWQFFSLQIPAPPVTSPWTCNISDVEYALGIYIGSWHGNSLGTANVLSNNMWINGISYVYSGLGASNIYSIPNSAIEFTGVQFEKGTMATSFEWRPQSIETYMCRRYCEAIPYKVHAVTAINGVLCSYYAMVPKRAVPYRINWLYDSAGTPFAITRFTASSYSDSNYYNSTDPNGQNQRTGAGSSNIGGSNGRANNNLSAGLNWLSISWGNDGLSTGFGFSVCVDSEQ